MQKKKKNLWSNYVEQKGKIQRNTFRPTNPNLIYHDLERHTEP